MDISSIMGQQVASLQHTVSMSIMKTAMSNSAAQAVVMLNDFQSAQQQTTIAPHPYAGKALDLQA